jgi:hypothetical protein
LRPRWSRPVACRCPFGSRQIHTSVQAGGIASLRMRFSVAMSRISEQAVVETVARLVARDAGHRVVDVAQLRAPCRDGGIERCDRRRNNVDISLFYVIGLLS